MTEDHNSRSLLWAVQKLSHLSGHALDRLQLQSLSLAESAPPREQLVHLCRGLGLHPPQWLAQADEAFLPLLVHQGDLGWCVLVQRLVGEGWQLLCEDGALRTVPEGRELPAARLRFDGLRPERGTRAAYQTIRAAFLRHKTVFAEAALACVMINVLALAASLYSMQVYDRVIPTQASATLIALTLGVLLANLIEIVIKLARSHLLEHVMISMDSELSRHIFTRLLSIRLDQFPGTVGSLSSQLRGYESIRGFLSASTLYVLVDMPFALVFMLLIGVVGSPWLMLVPLVFLVLSLGAGLYFRGRLEQQAAASAGAMHRKAGLLVEAVEGAEIIKAGHGGWRFLARWIDVNAQATQHDYSIRKDSEHMTHVSATLQQLAYVAMVAGGSLLVMRGDMTMGALIACSIISGRALTPMGMVSSLLVQRAHAKAALDGLERVYALQTDHHEVERPLTPQQIRGQFRLASVQFAYPGSPAALQLEQLEIQPGQKIGVLGPVGAGKSTLLRLLSGMYKPAQGTVLIDGMDIAQVSRQSLTRHVGYLPQDARLVMGTLRENLLIGLPDPGDDVVNEAARASGLLQMVADHPRGLDLPIAEGGKGVSGGQRQLVGLTRLLLSRPAVWLLDEPTASMDDQSERQAMAALKNAIRPEDTLVLVTHKPSMLALVDTLFVVAQHRLVLAGPKTEVLQRLQAGIQPGGAR